MTYIMTGNQCSMTHIRSHGCSHLQ